MYLAASSLPRRPGPRPSRRSSERNLTWARMFSGLMEASAALTAGGMFWARAATEKARREAVTAVERRVGKVVLLRDWASSLRRSSVRTSLTAFLPGHMVLFPGGCIRLQREDPLKADLRYCASAACNGVILICLGAWG